MQLFDQVDVAIDSGSLEWFSVQTESFQICQHEPRIGASDEKCRWLGEPAQDFDKISLKRSMGSAKYRHRSTNLNSPKAPPRWLMA